MIRNDGQSPLTGRFDAALLLASLWHAPQVKKGSGVPYLAHLLGVASLALDFGGSEDQAIAALLHDAVEDGPENTGLSPSVIRAQIEQKFGPRVLAIVNGCTDDAPEPGRPKSPWIERKPHYIASLAHEPEEILFVSACDKLFNARAILADFRAYGNDVFQRFRAKDGTLWYYRSIADAYAQRVTPEATAQHAGFARLVAELEQTVTALEAATGTTAEEHRGRDTAEFRAFG